MKPLLRSFVLAAAIAVIYCFSNVQAGLIVGTADGFGVDSLTIDTATGLEWLDWTASTNISFQDMNLQFGVGGDFEGFRHASMYEVKTLFDNMGLSTENFPSQSLVFGSELATNALGFLGTTSPNETGTFAITSDIFEIPTNPFDFQRVVGVQGFVLTSATYGNRSSATLFGNSQHGHALVRLTAVPEPTSLLMVGIGVATLVCRRRRTLVPVSVFAR